MQRLTAFSGAAAGRPWLVVLLLGAVPAILQSATLSLPLSTSLAAAGGVIGAVASAAGLYIRRPRPAIGWVLLASAAALFAFGWCLWQAHIFTHAGQTPALDSWRNILFLGFYPPFVGSLLYLLHRREEGLVPLLDTGILASGMAITAWALLLVRYVEGADAPSALHAAVQIAFGLGDVMLMAALIRLLVSPGARTPAYWLVHAAGWSYLFSNLTWNWFAQLGGYLPGPWADIGWVIWPVFLGAAALHPTMTSLYDNKAETGWSSAWTRIAMLLAASLIGPTTVFFKSIYDEDVPANLLVIAVGSGVLGVLVVAKLGLVLKAAHALSEQLAWQNQELLEAGRVKDDFVASVSHELRTPLTSIKGYLDLVREGEAGPLTDEQERFLGIVDRNADRLLHVVTDLLFVAQAGAGKLTLEVRQTDVGQIVVDAVEAARPLAESSGLQLASQVQALPDLMADPERLGQVLDNLISNALKFTPAGGTVHVRAFPEGTTLVLEVQDTGLGMSRDEQKQLFTRFYRTAAASERAIQGTGLGLAIVKAIVEAHGGTVSVASRIGAGTTLRVELPTGDHPPDGPSS